MLSGRLLMIQLKPAFNGATVQQGLHAALNQHRMAKMDFWEIYDQHYLRVKKLIMVLVRDEWAAEDLTQETFARV